MRVRVEDIPPEGLEVEFEDARVAAKDLGPQVAGLAGASRARLSLQRRGSLVLAKGSYQARVDLECSRCLERFDQALAGTVDWAFRPPDAPRGDEVRLAEDELEVIFYQGGEVDLAQALRDELSLALPMAPLCRPDCPGLCSVCGKDQRDGDCGCRPSVIDPRWAKLAKLE
ncbi:MAG: DUF177 domain-containing protein [Pseudomonadota bacterium]